MGALSNGSATVTYQEQVETSRCPTDAPKREALSWRRICHLFDQEKVARRHLGWKNVLHRCAVFDFSAHEFEGLSDSVSVSDGAAELLSPLPFPQIAVLNDWQFMACDSFWLSEDNEMLGTNLLAVVTPFNDYRQEYEIVVSGYVEIQLPPAPEEATAEHSGLRYTPLIHGNPTWINPRTEETRALRLNETSPQGDPGEMLTGMVWNLIRFLLYINDESRFVVRQSARKTGKPKKGRIPRAYQRPVYIVLDKETIKTRYLHSQPSGRCSPMPHLRRGHYRTLVADCYKNPGRRVWIRATHVKGNEVEWREGERRYKVI